MITTLHPDVHAHTDLQSGNQTRCTNDDMITYDNTGFICPVFNLLLLSAHREKHNTSSSDRTIIESCQFKKQLHSNVTKLKFHPLNKFKKLFQSFNLFELCHFLFYYFPKKKTPLTNF